MGADARIHWRVRTVVDSNSARFDLTPLTFWLWPTAGSYLATPNSPEHETKRGDPAMIVSHLRNF
jgi:hypothetical protein